MRKEYIRNLIKLIRKDAKKGKTPYGGILFNPTLEECDYIYKRNIAVTKCTVAFPSMFIEGNYWTSERTNYEVENNEQ